MKYISLSTRCIDHGLGGASKFCQFCWSKMIFTLFCLPVMWEVERDDIRKTISGLIKESRGIYSPYTCQRNPPCAFMLSPSLVLNSVLSKVYVLAQPLFWMQQCDQGNPKTDLNNLARQEFISNFWHCQPC
jgi:hypothetical protein